ncbi:TPM domain-containing protein [Allohahella marinimesophila]
MSLLTKEECAQVAAAIEKVEQGTDAELVTVLARQADDYTYIPLLWAGIVALILPGAVNYFTEWYNAHQLLLIQWMAFIGLSLLFRIPQILRRLVPDSVAYWRASNLARRQFLEQNLHRTTDATGMLIFVSEAEHYVEILVDNGISVRLPDSTWQIIVDDFTAQVRAGKTLAGFIGCIEACGDLLAQELPATHRRNELPNRLVILE